MNFVCEPCRRQDFDACLAVIKSKTWCDCQRRAKKA